MKWNESQSLNYWKCLLFCWIFLSYFFQWCVQTKNPHAQMIQPAANWETGAMAAVQCQMYVLSALVDSKLDFFLSYKATNPFFPGYLLSWSRALLSRGNDVRSSPQQVCPSQWDQYNSYKDPVHSATECQRYKRRVNLCIYDVDNCLGKIKDCLLFTISSPISDRKSCRRLVPHLRCSSGSWGHTKSWNRLWNLLDPEKFKMLVFLAQFKFLYSGLLEVLKYP